MFDGPFIAVPRWARRRIAEKRNGAALEVLCALIDAMNVDKKVISMTVSDIAQSSGLSRETVKRNLLWLESEGIIKVIKGAGRTPNQYLIQYSVVGSPMSLQAKTTAMESVGTLASRLTHEPTTEPKKCHLPAEMRSTIETLSKSISNGISIHADDRPKREPEMILGADPDRVEPTPTRTTKGNPDINDLTNHFIHHKTNVMRVYKQKDVAILRRTLKTLMGSGLTTSTIRKMIDHFLLDSRFADYDNPVLGFSSKKIQNLLLTKVGGTVVAEDPVLVLMSQDFERGTLDIPWNVVSDSDLRAAVTIRCLETLYRYPDLIAEIARHWAGDFRCAEFLRDLSLLEDLVKSGLGKTTCDVQEVTQTLHYLTLPKDLLKGVVRDSAGTMVSAIYTYRRAHRV